MIKFSFYNQYLVKNSVVGTQSIEILRRSILDLTFCHERPIQASERLIDLLPDRRLSVVAARALLPPPPGAGGTLPLPGIEVIARLVAPAARQPSI
ncbi:MAG: hypothetical protein WBG82_02075 [Parvibaculum sp.]|uniref:hypothetical protein n=1 Tax=Parvibaculum sp. TaxID=2024848 RepID=UPI003C743240